MADMLLLPKLDFQSRENYLLMEDVVDILDKRLKASLQAWDLRRQALWAFE